MHGWKSRPSGKNALEERKISRMCSFFDDSLPIEHSIPGQSFIALGWKAKEWRYFKVGARFFGVTLYVSKKYLQGSIISIQLSSYQNVIPLPLQKSAIPNQIGIIHLISRLSFGRLLPNMASLIPMIRHSAEHDQIWYRCPTLQRVTVR